MDENRFDELLGGDIDPAKDGDKPIEYYSTPASGRNLDFVQPSGEREFISYTLLTNCKINAEKTVIELFYSNGQHVTLNGRNLYELYQKIFYYLPRQITAVEKRYEGTMKDKEPIVFEIAITQD